MARKRPLIPLPRTSPRDVTDRLYEHRVPLGLATLAIFVIILGWWGYRTWQARQEGAAQLLLAQAFQAAERTKGGETPEQQGSTDPEEPLRLLRQAREDYPWTAAAEQALVQIGNLHYQRGEYQQAVAAYQEYLEQYPGGAWVLLAGLGKGYALEALERYEDAAATFRAFAERYKGHSLRADALMGLARSLSQLHQRSEALQVYARVIEEYPGTRWAQQAERKLGSSAP